MLTCTDKLLEISSGSLCDTGSSAIDSGIGDRSRELAELWSKRNGFYAFEAALHVFPRGVHCGDMSFERWNLNDTWRNAYGNATDGLQFFAEDIFGDQFAIAGDRVVSFNSETGELTKIADTIEEWACAILTDYEFLTGYPFAHDWQEKFDTLVPGQRLAPKVPFVFGGAYDVANLYAMDAVKVMLLRAEIYRQIKDMSDGARVKLTVER